MAPENIVLLIRHYRSFIINNLFKLLETIGKAQNLTMIENQTESLALLLSYPTGAFYY